MHLANRSGDTYPSAWGAPKTRQEDAACFVQELQKLGEQTGSFPRQSKRPDRSAENAMAKKEEKLNLFTFPPQTWILKLLTASSTLATAGHRPCRSGYPNCWRFKAKHKNPQRCQWQPVSKKLPSKLQEAFRIIAERFPARGGAAPGSRRKDSGKKSLWMGNM